MRVALIILAVLYLILGGPGRAEPVNQHQRNLLDLSEMLGALHHLRGLCRDEERTLWRDSMKELIRQENPSRQQAKAMSGRFNEGYYGAQDAFPRCTVDAEEEARIKAQEASLIITSLTVALDY